MINTFLFDLDGTLLPMEAEVFEREYFKKLSAKLSDHFKPDLLVKCIWNSTVKMVKNTGGIKTNKEVFFKDFITTTHKDIDILDSVFEEFYAREFKELGALVGPEKYMVKSIDILIERGYDIVVATNPIFPMAAVKERINWAGLDDKKFKYITSYEEMHYCKPNTEFYIEVLDKIGSNPHECIMIGNDVEEDMAASKLGIKTFLIENHIINRKGVFPTPDYKGKYEDFYKFIKEKFPTINGSVSPAV